ncbi:aspartic proteinase CDR1-like [Eucalyptus grandis]|uniref:aspartic proteinase CDR1-like n=1 Tax=Eucalyptus grandis TaxID=71139 RepID=UPI00192F00F3|nr:aspartic proteinase CDR1-like [Eucalyptus grandis]
MASSRFIFLLVCIIIIISSYPAGVASSKIAPAEPWGLAIKLIHHDSIQSPYYNPNATISERAERAINSSLARIRFLSRRIATPNDDDVRAGLIPAVSLKGFLAKISIGMPPVPQLVLIDMGSDLLWFQCLPCTPCFKQSPLFDPAKSSTYSNIRCGSSACLKSGNKCDPNNEYCIYERSYLNNDTTAGNLASEQATFETSDEGTVKVPIEMLGCGHVNKNVVDGQESGILGLGYGDDNFPTLVKQLGSKFSYCIGNIHDPRYQYNQLSLGNSAIMEGDSTTLEIYEGAYYLDLQGISVGEKKLQIDPIVFKRGLKGEGGVVIDSGATFTFIKEEGYVPLQNEVESLMTGKLNRVSHPEFLCYAGSVERDLTGFPVVTLQFSSGARLNLDINSMFFQLTAGVLCMAIVKTSPDMYGKSLIGVLAQQYHDIGYDIGQGKIFFQRIDFLQLVNFFEFKFDVPILNGENYKVQNELVLVQLGWMDIDYAIRKEEPPALTDLSAPAEIALYNQWEGSDRVCAMFIRAKISPSIRGSVAQPSNAKALLEAIDVQFESFEKALAMTLIMKFSIIKAH